MKSLNVSKECPRWMYEAFRALQANAASASVGLQSIDRGESPFSGGNPIAGVTDHGQLTGLVPDDDHTQYALLRGRTGGQTLYGTFPDTSSPTLIDSSLGLTDKASRASSSTSWSPIAIDTSASANTFVLLVLTTNQNNVGFATGNGGVSTFHSTITDTQSNTWVKLYEYSWQTQAGSDGMTVSVWYSKLTNALASGADTLSVTFSGAIQSKTLSARQFSGVNGSTISVVQSTATGYTDINSVVVGAQTLSSLATGTTYIALRALATHATTSTSGEPTFTATSGFTSLPVTPANCSLIAPEGTSRNVATRAEFSINNASSFTSDPRYPNDVSQSQFVDSVSVFLALQLNAPNPTGDLTLQSVNQTGGSRINLHNTDSYWFSDNIFFGDATGTQTIYIRGSDGAIIGDTATTDPGAGKYLYLLGFNNPPIAGTSSIASRAAQLTLSLDAQIYADNFFVTERSTDYSGSITSGFTIKTGNGFVNTENYGSFKVFGQSSAAGVTIDHSNSGLTTIDLIIKKRASQTGDMTEWQDSTGAVMSYVRASDGAFVGPFVASGSDVHPDNIFQIVGSVDPTKIAMFEVDGFAAGSTTRTLTVPDYSGTIILSQGSATLGQTIGTNAASHTGATANDLAIEGKILLGGGNATAVYGTSTLNISPLAVGGATPTTDTALLANMSPTLTGYTGVNLSLSMSSIAQNWSSSMRLQTNSITGTSPATGGVAAAISAFFGTVSIGVPTGTSATIISGGDYQVAIGALGGSVTNLYGNRIIMLGPTSGAGSISNIGGMLIQTNQRAYTVAGTLSAIQFSQGTGSATGAVPSFVGIEFSAASIISNNTATVNWTGIRIPNVTNPTGIKIAMEAQMPIITNKIRVDGAVPASVTHWVEIAAGTTTTAPIRFTSAAPITTPLAGCFEWQTDDVFFTITTGAARKAFILDDGARLTAGRVPFATTNGRLKDDANFLFTAGAGLTLSAVNLITDTTTGMIIGTAATQKISFWGAAPIVQPTTAGAAATFVANTSAIVDDSATFDGYTIGQVVKALRTAGLLA